MPRRRYACITLMRCSPSPQYADMERRKMTCAVGSHQMNGSGDRVDAEVGYGAPMGARVVGTLRVGLTTSQDGRDYRVGYGLRLTRGGND